MSFMFHGRSALPRGYLCRPLSFRPYLITFYSFQVLLLQRFIVFRDRKNLLTHVFNLNTQISAYFRFCRLDVSSILSGQNLCLSPGDGSTAGRSAGHLEKTLFFDGEKSLSDHWNACNDHHLHRRCWYDGCQSGLFKFSMDVC